MEMQSILCPYNQVLHLAFLNTKSSENASEDRENDGNKDDADNDEE